MIKQLVSIAIILIGTALPAHAACLSQGETRNAIASGKVLPVNRIQADLSRSGYGRAQSVQLCQQNGRYVYHIVALTPNGSAARLVVDANSGAVLSR
jgi:uncharacterized membrane protein YkoI